MIRLLGNKVICTESYDGFLENETYIISSVSGNEVYIRREINVVDSGCWFLLLDYYRHFITVAELREQQIKSVLDE
jgi:hypothetical protein